MILYTFSRSFTPNPCTTSDLRIWTILLILQGTNTISIKNKIQSKNQCSSIYFQYTDNFHILQKNMGWLLSISTESQSNRPEGISSIFNSSDSSGDFPCKIKVSRYFLWSLNSGAGVEVTQHSEFSLESIFSVHVISCTKSFISFTLFFLGEKEEIIQSPS